MSEALATSNGAFDTLGLRLWSVAKSWLVEPEQASDECLMEAVINGDDEAFSVLIERYQLDLFRYCLHFLKDQDRARDAAQDVLLKAYSKAGTFDTSRHFKPWFFRIARNLCLNIIQRDRLVKMTSLQDPAYNYFGEDGRIWKSDTPDPGGQMLELEKHEYLLEAMERLSPQNREIVELRFFQKMCARDIAAIVGSTEGAVRTKLHRALKMLRDDLAEYMA